MLRGGGRHMCGIMEATGAVKCFGYNNNGELGAGDTSTRNPFAGGSNVVTVNFGGDKTATDLVVLGHVTCALLNDDTVQCWGHSGSFAHTSPVAIDFGGPVSRLMGSGSHPSTYATSTLFVFMQDGTIKCWGYNNQGQLGLGDKTAHDPFVVFTFPLTQEYVQDIWFSGEQSTCATFTNGNAGCWGSNSDGRLGRTDANGNGDTATAEVLSIGNIMYVHYSPVVRN